MELKKRYERTRFTEEAIREAIAKFDEIFNANGTLDVQIGLLSVDQEEESWTFDNEEDFFNGYKYGDSASYRRNLVVGDSANGMTTSGRYFGEINVQHIGESIGVTICEVKTDQNELKLGQRGSLLEVIKVFDNFEQQCRLSNESAITKSEPVIFIGHGHNGAWRKLKDHLVDKHGYQVEAYETGARAGHAIRDILQSMLDRSSFALLVLTKDDEMADNQMRARQNVIHETGLFQGKLGFSRAIVLLESGTEDFSNIHGIEQIRFSKIEETFGDVIATFKREFE